MAVIRLNLTPSSEQRLTQLVESPARLAAELRQALVEVLVGLENYVKVELLRGGNRAPGSRRDGQLPLAVRSGSLLGSISHELSGPLSGSYGSTEGPASAYARALLDAGETVIRPVNANHLWQPIADNLTRSGQARMSPSEAFEQLGPKGGRLLQIFRSARGNLVAVLRKVKGRAGKLLFLLREQSIVKGTDALRVAYDRREGFTVERIQRGVTNALGGGGAS